MRSKFRFIAALLAALSTLGLPVIAYAAPTIYYESVYVGNIWTGAGTYDDSIPEQAPSDPTGEISADALNNSARYTSMLLQGQLGSGATITVQYWLANYDANGVVLSESQVGSATLTSSNLGTSFSIPAGVNALRFTATETAAEGGNWYLQKTLSTDTQLSSTGEIDWTTPPWVTSGTGGGTVTSTTTVTGTTTNVNVSVNFPAPPDWNAITTEIIDKFLSEIPPVPAPPGGSNAITASNTVTNPSLVTPNLPAADTSSLTTPSASVPTQPPESTPTIYSFTSGFSDIQVPTTDSQAFTVPDPINNLPHLPAGSMPLPGQVSQSGYTPGNLGTTYVLPQPLAPVPSTFTGPLPTIGSSSIGIDPVPSVPLTGTGSAPLPTLSGSTTPNYTVPNGTGTYPSYTFP